MLNSEFKSKMTVLNAGIGGANPVAIQSFKKCRYRHNGVVVGLLAGARSWD
jgi:hypothetical protein